MLPSFVSAWYLILQQKNKFWITPSMKGKCQDKSLLQTIKKLLFRELLFDQKLQVIKVLCFTEYTRQEITFRCHPNYKNKEPWYDYGLFAWGQKAAIKSSKAEHRGATDWNK